MMILDIRYMENQSNGILVMEIYYNFVIDEQVILI